ncbi:MAG TPA: IS66 family insertion sequence element accessory protein TnpB [Rhodanobacteraceae bacterium]
MNLPLQLWLCTRPTDMRKSYDGLAALVRSQLQRDPLCGQGFVFINRRRTQLRCLYFEAGGYCIWGKRLERGRYRAVQPSSVDVTALSPAEFQALIEGLDWVIKKRLKRWSSASIYNTQPDIINT